jgi:hypothetical protein
LPDNKKYERMTLDQTAWAFFEACEKEDWDEVRKFLSPCDLIDARISLTRGD